MIRLEKVTIDILGIDQRLIKWEFEFTSQNLSNFYLKIYRSEAPTTNTDYAELITTITDISTGEYVDTSLVGFDLSKNRQAYYILELYDPLNPTTKAIYGPYTNSFEPDLITLEILRRKKLRLDNPRYQARTVTVLKKKTWGTPCDVCYDSTTMRTTESDCTICYGTGVVGGYIPIENIKCLITSKPSMKQINSFGGVWDDTLLMFNFLNYPKIVPGDIIIDEQKNYYRVEGRVEYITKGNSLIEQRLRASQIDKSDIIYQFQI